MLKWNKVWIKGVSIAWVKVSNHIRHHIYPRLGELENGVSNSYNPGQNVLGHLRKLGTKTHFAKLTHILPLKKAWGCCYKGLFLLSPSPLSSVDCVELKLEYITSTLHRGGRGEGRCLNLTSYCVSVPRVLTRVVAFHVMLPWKVQSPAPLPSLLGRDSTGSVKVSTRGKGKEREKR